MAMVVLRTIRSFLLIFLTGCPSLFFAQQPELILQDAHSIDVVAAAISADKRLLATASNAGDIRLWDIESGLMLRSFPAPPVSHLVLSPTGRVLIAEYMGALNPTEIVGAWDVRTGKELVENFTGIDKVYLSPDEQTVAVSYGRESTVQGKDNENVILIRDLSDRSPDKNVADIAELEKLFPLQYLETVSSDRILVSDLNSTKLELVDTSSGKTLFSVKGEFLSRARYIAARTEDGKGVPTIEIRDQRSGELKRAFSAAELGIANITSASFVGDGTRLVISFGTDHKDSGQRMLNIETGALTDEKDDETIPLPGGGVYLRQDINAARLEVYDSASKNVLKTFDEIAFSESRFLSIQEVSPFAYSADGELLAVGDSSGAIFIWNTTRRDTIRVLEPSPIEPVESVEFDASGDNVRTNSADSATDFGTGSSSSSAAYNSKKYIVTAAANGLELRDASNGKLLKPLPDVKRLTFSRTQRYMALETDKAVEIWQSYPNQRVKSFPIAEDAYNRVFLGFSPDERTFLTSDAQSIRAWNSATGLQKWKHTTYGDIIWGQPSFSPDSKLVAITEGGTGVASTSVYYVSTARVLTPIRPVRRKAGQDDEENTLDTAYSIGYAAFSNDNRYLALLGRGEINIFDLLTFGKVASATTEYGAIPMCFSRDNSKLVTQNSQGELTFWLRGRDKLTRLASGFLLSDNDWLITSANGLFDGTPGAWNKLQWRFEGNTFKHAPVEAFFKEFYRPGLLSELLRGEIPRPPNKDLTKVDIRQPSVEVSIPKKPASEGETVTLGSIRVRVTVTENNAKPTQSQFPPSSGAQDVRLFRNGALVKIWRGDAFRTTGNEGCRPASNGPSQQRKAECEVDIPITAGNNEFYAYAFNHDNVKSTDSAIVKVSGDDSLKRPGTLYILAIGINRYDYPDDERNLNFADDDVTDISTEIEKRQTSLKRYSRIEVVKLLDEAATKANILTALSRFVDDTKPLTDTISSDLRKELEKIKSARPEDAVLIYYSGHGTVAGDRFYLIPHDGFPKPGTDDKTMLPRQSISDVEFETALENMQAGQLLMVLDTCNSGAIEGEEKRRGPMNSRGLAQLAYEKGMFILTASQSYQAAREAVRLGDRTVKHGLLTLALLDALVTTAPDKDRNGTVTEREWFSFAVDEVPKYQREAFESNKGAGFKNMKSTVGQTPRLFFPRDQSRDPFVVYKPSKP
jgi:WD40 repeat protein